MKESVPFFRPEIGEAEVDEVVAALRSGWLTTGPRVKRFEDEFAAAVGAPHAVAVNSCTAALHLAVEALGLKAGEAVLVPTMTFAATAEVVRYLGAIPVLVDCDPVTLNMDLEDAGRKLDALAAGRLRAKVSRDARPVGIIPVHVGGPDDGRRPGPGLREGARPLGGGGRRPRLSGRLAARRRRSPGSGAARTRPAVTCFSFYANKTITTGEGGMATTSDPELADRMRLMSLHGLSQDAWRRYSGGGNWDYRILAPGFKYNLTDVAAAIGIHQLARAETMRVGAGGGRRGARGEAAGHRRSRAAGGGRRTGSTPGTCFRSGCGSTGCRSTGRPSSTSSRPAASDARSTGGRCTFTPTTRRRSAGGRRTCRWPRRSGSGS